MPPIDDLDRYRPGQPDLVGVLWDALDDRYADADPDDVAEALDDALDALSPAEAFSFTNALRQIERAAGQAMADPTVRQVAGAALPVAGAAIGGPAGGLLGNVVAQRLAGATPAPPAPAGGASPPAPAGGAAPPGQAPVAGGSQAAMQALILGEQRELREALLRAAMGGLGQKTVNGIPVAQVLAGFSKLLGEAAADADAVSYHAGESADPFGESFDDGDSLYTALMDAADIEMRAS
jgi:hypothetical protein